MRIDLVKPLPRFQIQQHIYQLMSKKEGEEMTEQSTFQQSKPWQKLREPIHDERRYTIQIHCTRITELAVKPMK